VWTPAGVDPNTGCISFGGGTSIGWNGGTFTGGNADIANLPPTVGYFIHILGTTIEFQLAGLNLPSLPTDGTNCAALNSTAQLGQSCIVFGTSPFLLTLVDINPDPVGVTLGTAISLSAGGSVSDGFGPASTWFGAFTTQSTKLPSTIQSTILGVDGTPNTGDDGSVTESHSSTFVITSAVPEPGTWSMLMFGAGLVGLGYRRRKS
jgi:hypothetical protein